MSVLINMEMPEHCGVCRFAVDGWCYAGERWAYKYGKPNIDALANDGHTNFCPLIPVPPHGRLIDADALHQLFEAQWHYLQCLNWDENPTAEYTQSGVNWCINTMHDEAPTIIPADRTAIITLEQFMDGISEEKPKTNADRIRAMTDEELAQFLCETHVFEGACSGCIANEYCKPGHNGMFEWLREEVKE